MLIIIVLYASSSQPVFFFKILFHFTLQFLIFPSAMHHLVTWRAHVWQVSGYLEICSGANICETSWLSDASPNSGVKQGWKEQMQWM